MALFAACYGVLMSPPGGGAAEFEPYKRERLKIFSLAGLKASRREFEL